MAWNSLALGPRLVEETAVLGQHGGHSLSRPALPPIAAQCRPQGLLSGFGMGILRLSTLPTPILSKRMMTRRYVSRVSAPSPRPLDVG